MGSNSKARIRGSVPSVRSGMQITEEMIRSGPPPRKADAISKGRHSSKVMTPRQVDRVRSGNLESQPEDYADPSVAQKKAGEARRKAEDLRIAREFGL